MDSVVFCVRNSDEADASQLVTLLDTLDALQWRDRVLLRTLSRRLGASISEMSVSELVQLTRVYSRVSWKEGERKPSAKVLDSDSIEFLWTSVLGSLLSETSLEELHSCLSDDELVDLVRCLANGNVPHPNRSLRLMFPVITKRLDALSMRDIARLAHEYIKWGNADIGGRNLNALVSRLVHLSREATSKSREATLNSEFGSDFRATQHVLKFLMRGTKKEYGLVDRQQGLESLVKLLDFSMASIVSKIQDETLKGPIPEDIVTSQVATVSFCAAMAVICASKLTASRFSITGLDDVLGWFQGSHGASRCRDLHGPLLAKFVRALSRIASRTQNGQVEVIKDNDVASLSSEPSLTVSLSAPLAVPQKCMSILERFFRDRVALGHLLTRLDLAHSSMIAAVAAESLGGPGLSAATGVNFPGQWFWAKYVRLIEKGLDAMEERSPLTEISRCCEMLCFLGFLSESVVQPELMNRIITSSVIPNLTYVKLFEFSRLVFGLARMGESYYASTMVQSSALSPEQREGMREEERNERRSDSLGPSSLGSDHPDSSPQSHSSRGSSLEYATPWMYAFLSSHLPRLVREAESMALRGLRIDGQTALLLHIGLSKLAGAIPRFESRELAERTQHLLNLCEQPAEHNLALMKLDRITTIDSDGSGPDLMKKSGAQVPPGLAIMAREWETQRNKTIQADDSQGSTVDSSAVSCSKGPNPSDSSLASLCDAPSTRAPRIHCSLA